MSEIEIVDLQEISREEAKKQVIDYFIEHKSAWLSEIAEKLRLDIELIIDITNELEKEGKLREKPVIV